MVGAAVGDGGPDVGGLVANPSDSVASDDDGTTVSSVLLSEVPTAANSSTGITMASTSEVITMSTRVLFL